MDLTPLERSRLDEAAGSYAVYVIERTQPLTAQMQADLMVPVQYTADQYIWTWNPEAMYWEHYGNDSTVPTDIYRPLLDPEHAEWASIRRSRARVGLDVPINHEDTYRPGINHGTPDVVATGTTNWSEAPDGHFTWTTTMQPITMEPREWEAITLTTTPSRRNNYDIVHKANE